MLTAMTGIMRRRLIAVIAAYGVALQAVLVSFAVLSAAGAAPGLCTSGAPETPGPAPGRAQPCVACPAFCGDGAPPGVAPAGAFIPARGAAPARVEHGIRHLAERSAPRNLPPSRAPPAA